MVRSCYECGWKSNDITYHVINSVQVACCTQCATPIPLSAHVKPETGAINVSAAPGKPVVIDLADSDDDEKPAKARRVAEVIDLESDDEAPPAPAAPRPAAAAAPKKGPPVPPLKGVKPEKRPVKPEAVKPETKRPADDDGDMPLFSLKKKVTAPPPKKARLSEAGSSDDDGEPPPPPPQRSDFAAWLAEREKSGVPALDADQRRACDAVVRDGKNVFVTGSGGNGKSHVTRTILDFFGEHYGDMYGQRVAVCAPTGIAATHINGTTIHSATGIGVPKCNEDFRRMHQGFRKELWTKLVEVLVIDEISMLSGEWFDNLDRTLRELAHWYGRGDFQKWVRVPARRPRPHLFRARTWTAPPSAGGADPARAMQHTRSRMHPAQCRHSLPPPLPPLRGVRRGTRPFAGSTAHCTAAARGRPRTHLLCRPPGPSRRPLGPRRTPPPCAGAWLGPWRLPRCHSRRS